MSRELKTPHGALPLPAFLPDATRAVVKSVDSSDLENCGVTGLVVNTFHLLTRPGVRILAASGIHGFMGWNRPIVSDSGGFQIYSLLAKDPALGEVTPDGFAYRASKGAKRVTLTPAKSIQRQFQLGADLMICLDHCMHPGEPPERHRESVENTILWARECKTEFVARIAASERLQDSRPLLFAVIQGGEDESLRRECAERLLEIGFDGYGYGGWPIDEDRRLVESVELVAGLIPEGFPKFALGIASPDHIVSCVRMGYDLFDGAFPTRDARRKRLYVFQGNPDPLRLDAPSFHSRVFLQDSRYADDRKPVDESCDCLCCRRYSRSFLHHLFNVDDPLAYRLATIHNLRFYMRLMGMLANGSGEARLGEVAPVSLAIDTKPIVESLKRSRKYRHLCEDTIARAVQWASAKSRTEKEAVKIAKKKLHQVYAAFIDPFGYDYAVGLLDEFEKDPDPDGIKPLCRKILAGHRSTSERLPVLDRIFPSLFEITGTPSRIIDIACGFGPFAIPWMGLGKDAEYVALDIDGRIVDLLNRFFRPAKIKGEAQCRDVVGQPPSEQADVAFLLKTVPTLEQQEKGSSRRLIEGIDSKHIVVSFPTSSFGGRDKGMRENYESTLESITDGLEFRQTKVEFAEELFFVLTPSPPLHRVERGLGGEVQRGLGGEVG